MFQQHAGIYLTGEWNENTAMYSEVHSICYERKTETEGVGIKYVLQGEEIYTVNKKNYGVKNGSCLILNAGRRFELEIKEAPERVIGLCFYIDKQVLHDVRNYFLLPNELESRPADKYAPDIFETVYPPDYALNTYLTTITKSLHVNHTVTGHNSELFYDTALHFLMSQNRIRKEMLQLNARRWSTRKELYARLLTAKQMLDDSGMQIISVEEIAASSGLSQYHFSRCFRQLFGTSPYQYHVNKRLLHAKQQLLAGDKTIAEVAVITGFPDVQSFSKSFKKHFGITPGEIRRR